MHARGVDLWPAALTRDLVEETHLGWRMRCYPPDRPRTVGGLLERAAERLPCEAYYRTPYPELFAERPSPPPVLVHEEDTAFIMYTSGTTGRPKGAMGTHLGIVNSAITYERCYGLGAGERTLVAVPLFHVTGPIAQLLTLAHLGGTVVVMPTFDAAEALRLIDAERITHMLAAPTGFRLMPLQPDYRGAGATLRALGYGGAPLASETVRQLREWRPRCRLHNTYRPTETSSPATRLP